MGGQDLNELRKRGEPLGFDDPEAWEPMTAPARPAAELDAETALLAAPTLAEHYSAERLRKDCARSVFSIAALPFWRGASEGAGHGWGRELDRALGGLVLGRFLVVGAAGAKAGKTSFLMQLADGLALHSAAVLAGERSGPLFPTFILSEMSAAALTYRTLGRWFGCSSRWFTGAPNLEIEGAENMLDEARTRREDEIRRAQTQAAEELDGGTLAAMRRFQRVPHVPGSGADALDRAARTLDAWRAQLQAETGRDVWPVLLVDPIQRFASGNEVEGLNELAERLRRIADAGDGRIVLATSDTNKASAKGDADAGSRDAGQEAAAILRGSYALPHAVDAVIILGADATDGPVPLGAARRVAASVGLNRWGPAGGAAGFAWEPWSGRFMPDGAVTRPATKAEEKARRASDKEKREQDAAARRDVAKRNALDRAQTAAADAERKANEAELAATQAKSDNDPAKAERLLLKATNARAKATEARSKAARLAAEAGD